MSESIGGLWITKQELRPAETVTWSKGANRKQAGRAVGGRLYLTDERLIFRPNRLDDLLGASPFSAPLEAVTAIEEEPSGGGGLLDTLFAGGARDRLRVELDGDETELFVVNGLGDVVEEVRSRATTAPMPS